MNKDKNQTRPVVVGAGPLGLMTALMLAKHMPEVTLLGPRPAKDGRTTAILNEGIDLLEEIGVWSGLSEKTAPLKTMRLVDGTKRLIRAPETSFRADELDLDAFGYNVVNTDLLEVLVEQVDATSNINWKQSAVDTCTLGTNITLQLKNGTGVSADFIVAADGRNSIMRDKAEIKTKRWRYPQTALVLNLQHSRDHQFVSTEFHTESGPFTFVPLPGKQSSLVWVEKPEIADDMMTWSNDELARAIEEKSQFLLGDVEVTRQAMSYPLTGLTVQKFAAHNVLLVGESAHVFPPIGAQGMNLGIRDIKALVKTIITSPETLISSYDKSRRLDVALRTRAVDALNRSLLNDFLPIHLGRGLGLYALDKMPVLRKFVMQQGLGAR